MAKASTRIDIENIIDLAIVTVEREYGIEGLDHVLKAVESRRQTLIYEASKERTWAPK
jgi:ribosomal 50S subunit-recycling heat shock protein